MKAFRGLLCIAVIYLALALAAGCGGGGGKADSKGGDAGGAVTPDGGKNSETRDITGAFSRTESGVGQAIIFRKDGTFEGNAWGDHAELKRGTYRLVDKDLGMEVVLTFSGGGEEAWSVIIGEGRIAAVVSPEGDQFTRSE